MIERQQLSSVVISLSDVDLLWDLQSLHLMTTRSTPSASSSGCSRPSASASWLPSRHSESSSASQSSFQMHGPLSPGPDIEILKQTELVHRSKRFQQQLHFLEMNLLLGTSSRIPSANPPSIPPPPSGPPLSLSFSPPNIFLWPGASA